MVQWCQENAKGVSFVYVSTDDVVNHAAGAELEERYKMWSTVPGTRNYHMFVPTSISTLAMRHISFDTDFDVYDSKQTNNVSVSSFPHGSYNTCIYERTWYVQNILDNDLQVKLMVRSSVRTYGRMVYCR